MRTLARDVLILLSLSCVLLLLLEGSVRLFNPQRTEMEMVAERSLAMEDSRLGYRLKPGAVAVEHAPEFTARYTINQQGLRDAAQYERPKAEASTRLLLLGDSFAFGYGNDYDYIFPVLVEQELVARGRRVELVKGGVPGYDTRIEVLYLKQLFAQTAPDAVILVFLPNDLFTNEPLQADDSANRRNPAVVNADEKGLTLHALTLFQRLLMSNDRVYSFLYTATARRQYFQSPLSDEAQYRLATTTALLREVTHFCRERGVPLVVLSIPQLFQVLFEARGYQQEGIDVHYIDRELGRVAEQEGFRWISALNTLARAYSESGQNLYYRWDGHLNRGGNRVVGEYFADQLDSVLETW